MLERPYREGDDDNNLMPQHPEQDSEEDNPEATGSSSEMDEPISLHPATDAPRVLTAFLVCQHLDGSIAIANPEGIVMDHPAGMLEVRNLARAVTDDAQIQLLSKASVMTLTQALSKAQAQHAARPTHGPGKRKK